MELIHELEPEGRGAYTGSCGYLGFDGSMDLNILIRTIVLQGSEWSFHVGAGIVADSQPDREYQETLAKAEALRVALEASQTTSDDPTTYASSPMANPNASPRFL
jgi:anthranilate synthase component 1